MKKKRLECIIDEMVARIVERFDPERIILFGSAGRGAAGPDSDVDLLVVMPVQGSRREKAVDIGVAVNDIPLPKDIFVTTPEDFERRKEIVGTIERPAGREGRLVYARR
jgi:predicted nucleotidyltransferase